jgi:CubicO group peptidase (beta-lactamase class C family)
MLVGRRSFLSYFGAAAGLGMTQTVPGLHALTRAVSPNESFLESDARLQKADQIFQAEYDSTKSGSLTGGIIQGSKLVWSKSYGYANMEERKPANVDTIYRIGSITKQFTAIAFEQLVQAGKVRLTDPVEMFVPEIGLVKGRPVGSQPITLLQLATHTSGLDREPADIAKFTTGSVSEWQKTLIGALADLKYAYEPGTKYMYSNMGYAVLGLAVERISGQTYSSYVTEKVLKPLGMTTSEFDLEPALQPRLALGYEPVNGKADATESSKELKTGRGYKVPNGALFTTVNDLAKFVSFELGTSNAPLLDSKTYADTLSRVYSADSDMHSGYGLGFMAMRQGDLVLLGHGGSVAGFRAGAFFNRKSSLGIIYLRSHGQVMDMKRVFEIAQMYS